MARSAWSLKKQGPGKVTAGDIQTTGDIQILNPDLVICTLDEGAEIRMEFTVNTGKGYVAGGPQPRRRRADRPDPGRQPLFAGEEGQLPRREHARGPDPRLRQADLAGRDQWRADAGGRGRFRRAHPAGPAQCLRQFRGAAPRRADAVDSRARLQSGAAEEGRRTRTVGAFGQLPEERQHRLHRRPHPEDAKPRCCGRRTSAASR